jgi:hypothetical protein
VRIAAAICWYDEPIEHLRRVVESVSPLVDCIVAFDGRWESFPADRYWVPQVDDMREIVPHGSFVAGRDEWESQAAKRTALYRAAAARADWVLVIDADEELHVDDVSSFRNQLARIDLAKRPDAIRMRVATPGPRGAGGSDTATAPHGVRWQPRLLRADASLMVGPCSHRTLSTDECMIQSDGGPDHASFVSRRAGRTATIHGASIINRTHSRSAERIAAKRAYGKARAERGID